MKNRTLNMLIVLLLTSCASSVQHNNTTDNEGVELENPTVKKVKSEPHRYGGWYCPDNLNGFPAVDIAKWKDVPVVNGRMATKEETQNGTSLIFVDAEKYPDAKPLGITMPKLGSIYNKSSGRKEIIIIIQAINVDNDSIVGYRYLNGGNGSARLNEVKFISNNEAALIPASRFVTHNIQIKAKQDKIWGILTKPENAKTLRPFFDPENKLNSDWRKTSNVNYRYLNADELSAAYANKLYGCFYVQNDYNPLSYTEKFLLIENKLTGITEFKIACGPFAADYEAQKSILYNWGQKVKELSEK